MSIGFLFGYIIPWHADAMPASREFKGFMERRGVWPKGAKVEDVPQSGNAPQVMHVDDLCEVAPAWADLVEFGEDNAVVKKVFGWVRDMYAFDFALAQVGTRVHYPPVLMDWWMDDWISTVYSKDRTRRMSTVLVVHHLESTSDGEVCVLEPCPHAVREIRL